MINKNGTAIPCSATQWMKYNCRTDSIYFVKCILVYDHFKMITLAPWCWIPSKQNHSTAVNKICLNSKYNLNSISNHRSTYWEREMLRSVFLNMVNPYLFPTPPDLRNLPPREYIQTPDSVSGPWVVCPSVVLTEPPFDGSIIVSQDGSSLIEALPHFYRCANAPTKGDHRIRHECRSASRVLYLKNAYSHFKVHE